MENFGEIAGAVEVQHQGGLSREAAELLPPSPGTQGGLGRDTALCSGVSGGPSLPVLCHPLCLSRVQLELPPAQHRAALAGSAQPPEIAPIQHHSSVKDLPQFRKFTWI